jgi:hypothetical protein
MSTRSERNLIQIGPRAHYSKELDFRVKLEDYPDFPSAIMMTKAQDESKWEKMEFRNEKKGRKVFEKEPGNIIHIRSIGEADLYGEEFLKNASLCEGGIWLIGLDTEGTKEKNKGDPCTVQLSSVEGGKECYHVYQLFSESFGHCLHRSCTEACTEATQKVLVPPKLIEIFKHPKAVFVGKQIKGDILKVGKSLGIPEAELDQINVIELSTAYGLCRAIAEDPHGFGSGLKDQEW